MVMRNITLSISRDLLQQAKIAAVKEDRSLSGLMTDLLREYVEREMQYESAMTRSVDRMRDASPLSATYDWSREDLHERDP